MSSTIWPEQRNATASYRRRCGLFGVLLLGTLPGCDKNQPQAPGETGEQGSSATTQNSDSDPSSSQTNPNPDASSQGDTPSSTDSGPSTPSGSASGDDTNTPEPGGNNYLIGTGIYDITGEVAETALFGYATGSLRTLGLRDRQYARAFIMQEPGKKPAVFVSIDKGGMFQATNLAVMDKLTKKFNGVYNDENVIVSATHTHVASGGMSHYDLYEIAAGGYFSKNQEIVVQGILGAIERAHKNLEPGRIYLSRGSLRNASINRSKPAFNNNKDAKGQLDIDDEMTVLRFVNQANQDVGMLSWFAVHPTNLPNDWKYLSSDNKGYAAMKFESLKKSRYDEKSFVAAFAQSNAGDMSPNLNQPKPSENTKNASGPGKTPLESLEIIGERQYQSAKALFDRRGQKLTGSIQTVSRYVDFSSTKVDKAFTDQKQSYTTCTAALGVSFAAGAEDGRSDVAGLFKEGTTRDPKSLGNELDRCHAEKKILLIQGLNTKTPSTPKILPVSIMKIGQLGILAAPSEFTVMSGRRARSTVEAVPGTGIQETVLAGYADAYAGYVTTREEYAKQHYEGGSTHFGPWTLGAFRQSYHRLAQTIADPSTNPWPNPEPKVPRKSTPNNSGVTVVTDATPLGKKFGDIKQNASAEYKVGSTVKVEFWGAHPNNHLQTNASYLSVQAKMSGSWIDIALDRDQSTMFRWKRDGVARSIITVEWTIPPGIAVGSYRIVHRGHAKTGSIKPYKGTSREFQVVN